MMANSRWGCFRRSLLIVVGLAALLFMCLHSQAKEAKQKVSRSKSTIIPEYNLSASKTLVQWQIYASGAFSGGAGNTVHDCVVGHFGSQSGTSAQYVSTPLYWTAESLTCCQLRGNVDHSGVIDISDLTQLVAYMFKNGSAPPCLEEANVNGIGGEQIDIADLAYLVAYMFKSGPAPLPCPWHSIEKSQ